MLIVAHLAYVTIPFKVNLEKANVGSSSSSVKRTSTLRRIVHLLASLGQIPSALLLHCNRHLDIQQSSLGLRLVSFEGRGQTLKPSFEFERQWRYDSLLGDLGAYVKYYSSLPEKTINSAKFLCQLLSFFDCI